MDPWQIILIVILAVVVIGLLIYFLFIRKGDKDNQGIFRLPLNLLGMKDIPGVPFSIKDSLEATLNLLIRSKQTDQALNGLQNTYKIGKHHANGLAYLYGIDKSEDKDNSNNLLKENETAKDTLKAELENAENKDYQDEKRLLDRLSEGSPLKTRLLPPSLTQLSLTEPKQYAMGWTVFADVYKNAQPLLPRFAQSLAITPDGVAAATQGFWPMIAKYGLAFNLLLPKKISATEYEIDLTIFKSLEAYQEENSDFYRFTPAVMIHLRQDASKNLIPYSIEVSDYQGANSVTYIKGDPGTSDAGWMYALQAAKTAVTVYGIWLGHVYHWHIVTAALQMTMYTTLEENHPVRTLLDPQSDYLIGFDGFLLLTFSHAAPPTSVPNGLEWMRLENTFAAGRSYFDDDPHNTLARLGITQADFTLAPAQPWDQYIIVRYMLKLWDASKTYVTTYVNHAWPTGQDVVNDQPLHDWITASGDKRNGNVKGLPALTDPSTAQAELIELLTSYIYRITAHGSSRMNAAANPALSFIGNFPPTLQIKDLPPSNVQLTTEQLLTYLPKTGTIGSMITFLFTFVFSPPYESFIPATGIEQELFFGSDPKNELNQALIQFRTEVEAVINTYAENAPTYPQWPRNIET